MKALRYSITSILIIAGILFAAFMVLPLDSTIAEKTAEYKGYDVNVEYNDKEFRFYYNGLNEKEKLAYTIILDEIVDFPKTIIVPDLTDEELEHVFQAVSYDNPEYFFLSNKCSLTSIGSVNYFVPQYLMTQDEYNQHMDEIRTATDWILGGIPNGSSDYEKELYIHDLLASKCSYAESGTNMIYTIYGLLVDGSANCEGYSRTAQYLLNKVGIKNHLATGVAVDEDGVSQGHMWNVVVIDGESYNMDVTWDDYSLNDLVSNPDGATSHMYFNIPSDALAITHKADDEAMWSACVFDNQNYFVKSGLMFSNCSNATSTVISQAIVKSLIAGNCSLEIAFDNDEAYSKAVDYFISNGRMYTILKTANAAVPVSNKINPSQIQYTKDDNKRVLRFFFVKY